MQIAYGDTTGDHKNTVSEKGDSQLIRADTNMRGDIS